MTLKVQVCSSFMALKKQISASARENKELYINKNHNLYICNLLAACYMLILYSVF